MATAESTINTDPATRAAEFTRHRGPITCVAAVPGTSLAISSGYDSAVGLVDLEAGVIELLGYHRHLVNRVVVNEAGTTAATCSSDYTACLWDIDARAPIQVLRGHWDDVEDFAFVSDRVGISVSRDRRILVWNLETGAITRILEGHHRDVLSVEYAAGQIYTSGDDMTLRQWDLESGALIRCWGPFEVETDTCAIDAPRGRAILGADDGSIRIFDIDSGDLIHTIDAHRSGIKKVAVCGISGAILSAAYDQRLVIWDAGNFEAVRELERHPATWERSLNWSPDGQRVLAGTFDGTVLSWRIADGTIEAEIGRDADSGGNACLNDVYCSDSGTCATVSDDGIVRMAQISGENPAWLARTQPQNRILMNAVFVSQGDPAEDAESLVWAGAHDHQLHLFGRSEDQFVSHESLPLGEGPINCIRVLPPTENGDAGALAFAACYSGAVVAVRRRHGQSLSIASRFALHDGAVKSLRLRPDGLSAASGAADGSLLTWGLDGEIRQRLHGHTAIVDDVDFDPLGEFLASVSRDFTLNVFHVDSGRLVHAILLGRESPKCVLFLDPQTVLVGNYWGDVWRVDLERERVEAHRIAINGISSLARAPDGILAVSYDGSLSLLDSETMELKTRLRCLKQKVAGFETRASFD